MNSDELLRENQALRERLSRLSQASLRINESLGWQWLSRLLIAAGRIITTMMPLV